jgi:hypothetical protein
MMSQSLFYRAQAEAAQAAADSATLDNVRERCLRSAAAWADMADRVEHTDRLRAERTASTVLVAESKN